MSAVFEIEHVIRPMRERDIAAVLRIDKLSYEFPWTAGIFHDCLQAGYSCWVHESAGQVSGFYVLMIGPGEAHMLNVAVSPDWRGQGLGRNLVLHAIDGSRDRHARLLFLEVRPSNDIARKLYLDLGFEQIAIRRDYYPSVSGREDAHVMRLTL
ncbi:MAG: ribosomal protein S18-alanine N-acetyltransferase [Thiobacillaceae bacterium]